MATTAADYTPSSYDPAAYNGSDLSRPGIDGLGYDLSEIIGTADFPAFGYDEPSVERLSYDDPRFDDAPGAQDGYGDPRGDSGYDASRFDETRLDNFWADGDDWFGGSRGDSGRGGVSRDSSEFRSLDTGSGAGRRERRTTGSHRAPVSNETRLDLGYRSDQVRRDAPASPSASFNTPDYNSGPLRLSGPMKFDTGLLRLSGPMRFDETRLDAMPALAGESSRTATGLLSPPEFSPVERSWADETSLDSFGGLELRPARPPPSCATPARSRPWRPFGRTAQARQDTGGERTVGRRRGRSSDRRQWLALGAVAIVAAGAITGVLAKFHFAGSSGPTHTISTPAKVDSFTRSPSLEKAMDVNGLRDQVMKGSSGQASDVLSAVYAQGNVTPGAGGSQQIFMFVGGHLANSDPGSSITSFEHSYPSAQVVPAGRLAVRRPASRRRRPRRRAATSPSRCASGSTTTASARSCHRRCRPRSSRRPWTRSGPASSRSRSSDGRPRGAQRRRPTVSDGRPSLFRFWQLRALARAAAAYCSPPGSHGSTGVTELASMICVPSRASAAAAASGRGHLTAGGQVIGGGDRGLGRLDAGGRAAGLRSVSRRSPGPGGDRSRGDGLRRSGPNGAARRAAGPRGGSRAPSACHRAGWPPADRQAGDREEERHAEGAQAEKLPVDDGRADRERLAVRHRASRLALPRGRAGDLRRVNRGEQPSRVAAGAEA